MLKSEIREIPLKDLEGGKLDTSTTDELNSYPLVLLTRSGKIRVNLVNADGEDKQAIASRINNFVKNPTEKTITIQEDLRGLAYSLGAFIVIGGLLLILKEQLEKAFGEGIIEDGWSLIEVIGELFGLILNIVSFIAHILSSLDFR